MIIIDFLTYIFPDAIAQQGISELADGSGNLTTHHDATLGGLISSMDRARVVTSVVANVADTPARMIPISDFCDTIFIDRVAPLLSFHPSNDTLEVEEIFGRAQRTGVRGISMHPERQKFSIDDKYMYGFYELMASFGFFLMLQCNAGLVSGERDRNTGFEEKVKKVADWFRDLPIICAYYGGNRELSLIRLLSSCNNVYLIRAGGSAWCMGDEPKNMVSVIDKERILFGSCSPLNDQQEMAERILTSDLRDDDKEMIMGKNAARLLRIGKEAGLS